MGAVANGAGLADDAYAAIGDAAPAFRVEIGPEELAAVPSTFSCMAAKPSRRRPPAPSVAWRRSATTPRSRRSRG